MKKELKEAALSMTALMAMAGGEEIVRSPNRFYGMVCDFLSEPRFGEAKRLIKKGIDSGTYTEILNKKSVSLNEVQKFVLNLMNSEFLTEAHAREIVGMIMIAIDPSIENSIAVEKWIDECAEYTSGYDASLYRDRDRRTGGAFSEIIPLVKRLFIFLEEKNWASAEKYAERILDKDPECSRAYLGKLMAELKVPTEALLGDFSDFRFSYKENFKHACKYATDEELKELKNYECSNDYAYGKALMNRAQTEGEFKTAADCFEPYPTYRDAKVLYDKCIKMADDARKEVMYKAAINAPLEKQVTAFAVLAGYKDSNERRKQAIKKIEDNKRREFLIREEKLRKEKRKRKLFAFLTFVTFVIIAGVIAADIYLTYSMRSQTMSRFLWLPLVSVGACLVVSFFIYRILDKNYLYVDAWIFRVWTISSVLCGIARGVMVVIGHIGASSGVPVWITALLCALAFILNSVAYFISAFLCHSICI